MVVLVGETYRNLAARCDVRVVPRPRGLNHYAVEVRSPGASEWRVCSWAPTLREAARFVELLLRVTADPSTPTCPVSL
jgi:hypothetical protein